MVDVGRTVFPTLAPGGGVDRRLPTRLRAGFSLYIRNLIMAALGGKNAHRVASVLTLGALPGRQALDLTSQASKGGSCLLPQSTDASEGRCHARRHKSTAMHPQLEDG